MPTSHRYQLSLKSLLLVVLYLSVGLMASVKPGSEFGTSVFELALYSVACALIVGLVMQTRGLRHLQPADSQQLVSLRLAIAWRLAITTVLFGNLLLKCAITRGWTMPPGKWIDYLYHGIYAPIIPDIAICSAVVAAIYLNLLPATDSRTWWRFPLTRLIWILACLAFTIAALTEFMLIPYYTYKALAGIEHSQKPEFQRAGAYLDPQATGHWFFWLACAGMLSLLAGAALWYMAVNSARRRTMCGVLGTIFLGASIVYGWWFLGSGWPTLAPDFAEAGLQSRWWHWFGAGIVLSLFIPLAAYLILHMSEEAEGSSRINAHLKFPLVLPMIAFGALGSVCVAVEIIAAYFDNSLYMQTFSELLWSMLTDLNIYLPVALTLVFLRLLWSGIRGKELQTPIPMIDARKFAWTCVVLAVLIPVAIPTTMAFSFAMWLSPWLS